MAANGNKGKISDSVRKRAGAPTKEQQLKNKIAQAELKMEEVKVKLQSELTSGNERLVKEYINAIDYLISVSRGEVKGATVVNRMNACKMVMDKVEELQKALDIDSVTPEHVEETEEEDLTPVDKNVVSLINY